MELAERSILLRRFAHDSMMVSWTVDQHGNQVPQFIGHARAGYLADAPGFGTFQISRGGRRVSCAAAPVAAWRWQRFLVGQVLPFAATLRGFEPWHASAVALESGALALVGDSGRGKSSLAAELILQGAVLMADDVIALELTDSGVTAHPGPGLMSLRRIAIERLTQPELRALGRSVGRDSHSIRLAVARHEHALPLAGVYLLERAPDGDAVKVAPVPDLDPRRLLGSTFNFAISTPRRLIGQLDVCARIASSVRVMRVTAPIGADNRALAKLILADAGRVR
jgi:hypothetical protein